MKTKPELIAILTERGHTGLSRKSRADLAALAEDAESVEFLAAEEAALAAEPPTLTGDLLIPVEQVLAGDVWPGNQRIGRVQAGRKWTYLYAPKAELRDHFLELRSGSLVHVYRKASA